MSGYENKTQERGPCTPRMEVPMRDWSAGASRTALLAVASALTLALVACGGDAQAGTQEEGEAFQRTINVEVMPLERAPFTELIRVTGTIQAYQDVVISAEESGVIREVLVEKGALVEEGQPIARIDDRILRAQVDEARAQSELARETWERRQRLFEADEVGSELQYLEARYNSERSRATLTALEERLDRTVIRAPIPGTLDTREVEVGTMVSAGTPVARLVRLNPVKVRGGVPERFAGDVRQGSSARVTFDVLDEEVEEVAVTYVGSTVDPQTRTFEVEVVVPNPGRIIKPEMVANIEIVRQDHEDALFIPQDALVRVEDGYVAYVVAQDEEGRTVAQARSLTLGPAQRNLVLVRDGLSEGEELLVVGHTQVADRDQIRVVETRSPVRDAVADRRVGR